MNDYQTRLNALRQEMDKQGLDAFIIPQADAWQSESLSACDERLYYICGLRASAGFCVVTKDHAVFLIDGRYTVQAKEQVDTDLFDIAYYTDILPEDWAVETIGDDGIIGYDPWLVTVSGYQRMTGKNLNLKPVTDNPVDAIWSNRPSAPIETSILHDIEYAGQSVDDKLQMIAENCKGPTLITAPDSLAWLLNMRVLTNSQAPGLRGYGLYDPSDQTLNLYTDVECPDFHHSSVPIHPMEKITSIQKDYTIPKGAPSWFYKDRQTIIDYDPCTIPKACKNKVEQEGIRQAHKRDARAVTSVIEWLQSHHGVTEEDFAQKLTSERIKANLFHGISFDPIVGFNANGAKIHGSPSSTKIEGNGLLLIDSGGQYKDGTTDITRTIAIGTPSQEMIEKYTLVLKAHIALATAIFPEGTSGKQLDALARAPLWAHGIDYAHGTGHGVGHFLNVHEGPANISPRSDEPLREGMLLSNEPGYYKEGAFGIRLENLMLVQPYMDKDDPKNETGKALFHFETVTKVPFDGACINAALLSHSELRWLNQYQKSCA